MYAAEDDVAGLGARCLLRQFVGVASEISEPNDLIALVVVPQNDGLAAQRTPGRGNTVIHGVVGKNQEVIK